MQYLAEVCEVNLEAEDNRGCTPLHIAAACGHLGLVQYLVQNKKLVGYGIFDYVILS